MVNVERTFTVDKPVDVVVDYLRDFSRTEAWDPGTISCIRVDDGPIVVGSRWHNVSEFRGKETELDYRLVRLEAQHLTFVGKNKTATSTDDFRFAADGTGTAITYHATIEFNGIAKLADPFLRGLFEKLADGVIPAMTQAIAELPA